MGAELRYRQPPPAVQRLLFPPLSRSRGYGVWSAGSIATSISRPTPPPKQA